MPIHFETPENQPYFIARWHGVVTNQEMLESYMGFYRSARWKKTFHEIVDQRSADMGQLTAATLQRMAELVAEHFKSHRVTHSRTAVVCQSGLHYGLSRIYEVWAAESDQRSVG